jgi:hypothetical protein
MKRDTCVLAIVFLMNLGAAAAQPTSLNLSRDLVALGIASRNAVPNTPTLDSRPLFQAGLDYAQSHHIPLVTVDTGAYYLLTTAFADRYVNVYRATDLTIDLAGSTIYFNQGLRQGFAFTECQRVTLTNLQIDYLNPPYTHVELTAVDTPGRALSYRTLAGWADPATLSVAQSPTGPFDLWAVAFRNGALVPALSRMPVSKPISNGVLRLEQDGAPWTQPAALSTLRPGDIIVVTQRGGGNPIQFFYGDSLTLSNVSVFGSSSFAVWFSSVSNSTADRVQVKPRPGTGLIGSNVDGIHFSAARQNNRVRNCFVTRTLDDAIAFDSLYIATVLSQSGPRQLRVRRNGYERFPNGTPINFVDTVTTREMSGATIVSRNPPDGFSFNAEIDLVFDRDLPSLPPGTGLAFGSASLRGAGSIIEDNTIEEVPFGRGIWISGNIGVSVRRNAVGRTSNGGIVASQDTIHFPAPRRTT